MKTRMLSCLLCALFPVAHAADRESPPELALLVKLQGSAAKCSIDRRLAMNKAKGIDTPAAYDSALSSASKCVDVEMPAGKGWYRAAVDQAPDSKPQLTRLYAAWTRYMGAVETTLDADELDRASHEFDVAASEIQAQLATQ